MIVALACVLAAVLGGAAATLLYDERSALMTRLAAGACTGLAGLGLTGFALAGLFGLTSTVVLVAALISAAPLVIVARRAVRAQLRAEVRDAWSAVTQRPAQLLALATLAVFLGAAFERALYMEDGAIWTGDNHNLGDLPFHLGIVSGFVHGDNLPPEHPELAGARLTYPFLVDFIAALLVRVGASLRGALLTENLLLVLALLVLLHAWTRDITGDGAAARLVPFLVFFSGGLGWLQLLREARTTGQGLLALLWRPPHDYTISDQGLRFGNAVLTLLIPQRALLLGLPLFLVMWRLWWRGADEGSDVRTRGRALGAAGVVAGLLPLAHTHSFAVALSMGLCVATICVAASRLARAAGGLSGTLTPWLRFFVVAALVAGPQVLWLSVGSSLRPHAFVAWQPGWDHGRENIALFWLLNAGLYLPALIAAVAWRGARPVVPARLLRFLAPFALLFILPNLWRLSPWIWDNIKFLFYWHVASAPLVALLLVTLWREGRAWERLGVAAVVVVLTLAGALDVWRMAGRETRQQVFDRATVAAGEWLRTAVPKRALVLHVPTYNHAVLLAGRRSLLGYPGHVPSQGLDAGDREAHIRAIYTGAAEAEQYLGYYRVDYILVGPQEHATYPVNEHYLSRFPVLGEVAGHRLLSVAPR